MRIRASGLQPNADAISTLRRPMAREASWSQRDEHGNQFWYVGWAEVRTGDGEQGRAVNREEQFVRNRGCIAQLSRATQQNLF